MKILNGSLGENFEKILIENWDILNKKTKFNTTYIDKNKEVTLRFRIKDRENDIVFVESEKEIRYLLGELSVEKNIIKIQL